MRFQVIVNAIRWSSATKLATTRGLSVLAASAFGSASASSFRYSDVRSVPVYQPVVEKKEKKIIAKSVVTSNASKSERGLFIQWVKEKSLGLLGMFAKATNKTGRFIRYLHRFVTITVLGAPMAVLAPLAYFTGSVFPTTQDLAMAYGVWAMETLGPAFVKMGQWASTRPDLYPPRVVSRLAALQDDVKVHYSMKRVEQTLDENLGADWKSYLQLDPNPIGAGCIAQVFRGTLNTVDGPKDEQVAVKVIHPHVKDLLKTDMELLTMFANCLDLVPTLKLLSIGEACRGFCKSMNDQLDMKKEAYNMVHFNTKFEKEKWANFPTPFEDLTTSNVLVETLMSGTSITKFMELKDEIDGVVDEKVKLLKHKLSDICGKVMIKMIFFDNFIHGDLHPGNILVNVDKEGEPSLVLLDTGIVFTSKDQADHDRIVDICVAFMQHDGRKAAKLMLEERDHLNGITENEAPIGGELGFIDGVQALVDSAENDSYFEHLGEYVSKMCDLAREHRVKLNPGYFHIAMALKVTEGISLALDRDLDLISSCLPVIVKAKAMQKMGMGPVFGDIDTEAEAKKKGAPVRIAKSSNHKA